MIKNVIAILLISISFVNRSVAQHFDHTFSEHLGSVVVDIIEKDSNFYAVVSNGLIYSHDPLFEYKLTLYKIIFSTENPSGFMLEEAFRIDFTDHQATYAIEYVAETRRWMVLQSAPIQNNLQLCKIILYDENFEYVSETTQTIPGYQLACFSESYNSKTYFLGSIIGPPSNKIFYCTYDHSMPDSLGGILVTQSNPQNMFWITSMTVDSLTGNLLTFYYDGISMLDSTLHQVINLNSLSNIRTSDHGSIAQSGNAYFSHGLQDSLFNSSVRKIVLHKYDTAFQIIDSASFGRSSQDNYPFINQSIAIHANEIIVGGHLDGPFNGTNFASRKKFFYISKYDLDLNQIWYREYGGEKAYIINGIEKANNGTFAFGLVTDSTDGYRYAYLMYVDENGDIISSTTMPPKMASSIQIVNPGSDHFEMLNPEAIAGTLRLYDLQGRMLKEEDFYEEKVSVTTDFLPAGSYLYTISSKSTHVISGRWIKI